MNHRIRFTVLGFVLAGCLMAGGCGVGQREAAQISYYLIQPEFAPQDAGFGEAPCVVIRSVTAQTTYRELPLLYRTSDVEFETDYYNRFMTSAPNQLTEALRRWADTLDWTVCPEDTVGPDTEHYILRPVLEVLYGDFRDRDNPAAFVRMQFTLSRVDPGCRCARVVFSQLYTAREPLESRSPDALVLAQSRAVEDIMARLTADIAKALQ